MSEPRPGGLRSVEEHLGQILAATAPLPAVVLPLLDALDLAATEEIVSPMALPRFDNSAMDGYAVRAEDVAAATAEAPVRLRVVGEIGAGQADVAVGALPDGTAAKIMTGAPLPQGADCVVPYEWTDRGAEEVTISRPAALAQHVRYAGEDVSVGEVLVTPGTALGPRHLGLLASVGCTTVSVRPRPRVVIISTGSELRAPGDELDSDSIYDGNSFLLAAAVRRAGGEAVRVGLVPDRPELLLDVLDEQLEHADVIVTSGGISMGDYDIVKEALSPLGSMWFGGVAMQPGKPQGFGRIGPRGAGAEVREVPFFALPGNPVSAYLSFEVFVRPALRTMMGLTPVSRTPARARLTHRVGSPAGRRQFRRGVLSVGDDGVTVAEVEPVGGSGSHLVGDLAASNALIVVPEDVTEVAAGETVTVIRLDQE